MANTLSIRLLTPSECVAERARLSNVTVIDESLHETVYERYDRSALRDVLLGKYEPEAFDYQRPTGNDSDRADPVRP